jgi:hypothetical protein
MGYIDEELKEENDADNYKTFLLASTVLSAKFEIEIAGISLCPTSRGSFLALQLFCSTYL